LYSSCLSSVARRLEVSAARRVVYVALRKAGLPTGPGGVSPHWLRHAHATHAMNQGGPGVHLVKATLGHASVATTSTHLQARLDDSSAPHLGL
jgi:integrase/recombinase XerD